MYDSKESAAKYTFEEWQVDERETLTAIEMKDRGEGKQSDFNPADTPSAKHKAKGIFLETPSHS